MNDMTNQFENLSAESECDRLAQVTCEEFYEQNVGQQSIGVEE